MVQAVRKGHWILLDEINLASAETLESISGLLDGGSICLAERGDVTNVPRHPNFRLFSCMNPATDVGKKDLPPGLRNRFSEFWVSEVDSREDLLLFVRTYLANVSAHPPVEEIVDFYQAMQKAAKEKLTDGSQQRPHYSLRTLVRSLSFVRSKTKEYGLSRAVYDAFSMSFLSQVSVSSAPLVDALIARYFIPSNTTPAQFLRPIKCPGENYVSCMGFWVEKGDIAPDPSPQYIITPTIQRHLRDLTRIVLSRCPALLQGPTSSGKTSMVEYLAKISGHRYIRINNHEHTDLQVCFLCSLSFLSFPLPLPFLQ